MRRLLGFLADSQMFSLRVIHNHFFSLQFSPGADGRLIQESNLEQGILALG